MNKKLFLFTILFFLFSFQIKKSFTIDHIVYLNKVNEIDSIYRFKNDTLKALKMYHELFKKYPPHNSYLIEEYQTYITLSDKYQQNFGGKESLYKLIPLVAPNWKYNRMDKDFFALYKKYGIDSLEVEEKIDIWKKGLNRKLVDSFTVASSRDREKNRSDGKLSLLNDKKNRQLFIWTFNNYGYPSRQKIGLWGNNDVFMTMDVLLNHIGGSGDESYGYFKEKILEYVKSGDCLPIDYALMIDKKAGTENAESVYGVLNFNGKKGDTVTIDRNRKKIGMPSLKHSKKIRDDFFKE